MLDRFGGLFGTLLSLPRPIEGVVSPRFDSGAKVTIEAPAELSLSEAMHCTLLNGAAVAEVTDSAKGFRITTPTAQLSDFGTRFSVVVDG